MKRIEKGRANLGDNPGSGTFDSSNQFTDGKLTLNNPLHLFVSNNGRPSPAFPEEKELS